MYPGTLYTPENTIHLSHLASQAISSSWPTEMHFVQESLSEQKRHSNCMETAHLLSHWTSFCEDTEDLAMDGGLDNIKKYNSSHPAMS